MLQMGLVKHFFFFWERLPSFGVDLGLCDFVGLCRKAT